MPSGSPWYLGLVNTPLLGKHKPNRNMPDAFRRAIADKPNHWEKKKGKKFKKR
jgi:hypothetical protein